MSEARCSGVHVSRALFARPIVHVGHACLRWTYWLHHDWVVSRERLGVAACRTCACVRSRMPARYPAPLLCYLAPHAAGSQLERVQDRTAPTHCGWLHGTGAMKAFRVHSGLLSKLLAEVSQGFTSGQRPAPHSTVEGPSQRKHYVPFKCRETSSCSKQAFHGEAAAERPPYARQ